MMEIITQIMPTISTLCLVGCLYYMSKRMDCHMKLIELMRYEILELQKRLEK